MILMCLFFFFQNSFPPLGNFILPPSSNMSLFRSAPPATSQTVSSTPFDVGQLRVTGRMLQFGRLLILLENSHRDEEPPLSDPPVDGATFESLTIYDTAQISGHVELWQEYEHEFYDFIVCQTITFNNFEDQDGHSQLLSLTVFNQCDYDIWIFTLVMGIVGGFILLVSAVYLVLVIVKSVRASVHEPPQRDYEIKDYDL